MERMAKHINVNWNANNDKGIRGKLTPVDHEIN